MELSKKKSEIKQALEMEDENGKQKKKKKHLSCLLLEAFQSTPISFYDKKLYFAVHWKWKIIAVWC